MNKGEVDALWINKHDSSLMEHSLEDEVMVPMLIDEEEGKGVRLDLIYLPQNVVTNYNRKLT